MKVKKYTKGEGAFESSVVYEVDADRFNELLKDGLSEADALDDLREKRQAETITHSHDLLDVIDVFEENVTVLPEQDLSNKKPYCVTLKMTSGEIEIRLRSFELADNEEEAGLQAVENEARDKLEWNDDKSGAFDMNGELHYSIIGVKEITIDAYAQIEMVRGVDSDLTRQRPGRISIG